jgi:small subunit ribosomal protein S17
VRKPLDSALRASLGARRKNNLERGKRKIRTGVVTSNKMAKTAVVEVERVYRHPLYQKVVRMTKKIKAHDEKNEANIGDLVEVMETRPFSRDKRWRLIKILGKGKLRLHELPKKREKKEVEEVEATEAES